MPPSSCSVDRRARPTPAAGHHHPSEVARRVDDRVASCRHESARRRASVAGCPYPATVGFRGCPSTVDTESAVRRGDRVRSPNQLAVDDFVCSSQTGAGGDPGRRSVVGVDVGGDRFNTLHGKPPDETCCRFSGVALVLPRAYRSSTPRSPWIGRQRSSQWPAWSRSPLRRCGVGRPS